MKIDQRKKVREVAGEHIVIMQEGGEADMTRVVALNESALWLYRQLCGQTFDCDDAVRLLLSEYDIDEATARRDAAAWLDEMKHEGLIVDE